MYFTSCIFGGSIICLLIQCKKKAADRINSNRNHCGELFSFGDGRAKFSRVCNAANSPPISEGCVGGGYFWMKVYLFLCCSTAGICLFLQHMRIFLMALNTLSEFV